MEQVAVEDEVSKTPDLIAADVEQLRFVFPALLSRHAGVEIEIT